VPSDDDSALEARLLAAAGRRSGPVRSADLLRAARIDRAERIRARTLLGELEERGLLVRKGERLTLADRLDLMPGRLNANRAGFAFVVPDDPERDDVYVPASAVRPAMHGDRVLVRVERIVQLIQIAQRIPEIHPAADLSRLEAQCGTEVIDGLPCASLRAAPAESPSSTSSPAFCSPRGQLPSASSNTSAPRESTSPANPRRPS